METKWTNLGSGDILAISQKGLKPCLTQLAGLSVPNIGPLGRWGIGGISSIGIVCRVFGQPAVYEATFDFRPAPCIRSNTQTPIGGQAHFIETFLSLPGDVWHYPLRYPLYDFEEDRLLAVLDHWVGRKIGGVQLCGAGLDFIGRLPANKLPIWTPQRFVRFCRKTGVLQRGKLLRA